MSNITVLWRKANGRLKHTIKATDKAGAPLTISGSQFAIQLRGQETGAASAVTITLSQPGTEGWLTMEISAADMETLSGGYNFDILEKDAAGKIYHFRSGEMYVLAGVTIISEATWQ